jgi:hypothetical protein
MHVLAAGSPRATYMRSDRYGARFGSGSATPGIAAQCRSGVVSSGLKQCVGRHRHNVIAAAQGISLASTKPKPRCERRDLISAKPLTLGASYAQSTIYRGNKHVGLFNVPDRAPAPYRRAPEVATAPGAFQQQRLDKGRQRCAVARADPDTQQRTDAQLLAAAGPVDESGPSLCSRPAQEALHNPSVHLAVYLPLFRQYVTPLTETSRSSSLVGIMLVSDAD